MTASLPHRIGEGKIERGIQAILAILYFNKLSLQEL